MILHFTAAPLRRPYALFIISELCPAEFRLGAAWVIGVVNENNSGVVRTQNYLCKYRILGATGNIFPATKTELQPTFYLNRNNDEKARRATAALYRYYREIKPFAENHYYHQLEANYRQQRYGGIIITLRPGVESIPIDGAGNIIGNGNDDKREVKPEPKQEVYKQSTLF